MKTLILAVLAVCSSYSFSLSESADLRRMQELDFLGRKYYREGEYRKAKNKFKKIQEIQPGHSESLRMIALSREKMDLSEDLLEKALESYQQQDMETAAKILQEAREKDPGNEHIESLLSKVYVDRGIEKNIKGKHGEAIEYFERAAELSPQDTQIGEFIEVSRSLVASDMTEPSPPSADHDRETVKLFELFEQYQRQQDSLFTEYAEKHRELQQIVRDSEQEKEKIFQMLQDREERISRMLEEKEEERFKVVGFFSENREIIGGGTGFFLLVFFYVFAKRNRHKKNIIDSQRGFQKRVLDSFQKLSGEKGGTLSDLDKKFKKLDIIEKELTASTDISEKNMAIRMLAKYLKDSDLKVRMRALKTYYILRPEKASGVIKNIAERGSASKKKELCGIIEEMASAPMVKILFEFLYSPDEELKKAALKSLQKIKDNPQISAELRKRIEKNITEVSLSGGWIVS